MHPKWGKCLNPRITLIRPFKQKKREIGKKTMKNMESWLRPIIKVEIH
jgi:hypothetical protein